MVDIRDRHSEGIVLRAKDYREEDKLLTLVTANGPEIVIARGARKATSPLRPLTQTMSRVKVLLSPPKNNVSFLKEGIAEESYLSPAGDSMDAFAYSAYLAELLLAAWPENKPAPELYGLLLSALTLLKLDDDLPRTARFFELRLLAALGLLPQLEGCGSCGQTMGNRGYLLCPADGMLYCLACGREKVGTPLSPGAIRTMRCLLELPLTKIPQLKWSAAIGRELEQALDQYLRFHLDYPARAKAMLKQLT